MKPITPDELLKMSMPDQVIETFNKAIKANWDGSQAIVRQDRITQSIAEELDIQRSEVFDRGYLNIEELYRAAGWKVKYDKPGHNENYPATFTFTR